MKNKKKLEGIWGWLLLPVIGLIIGAVISMFVSIISLFLLDDSEFQIYFIGFIIGSFFSVYTLFLIFKKKKESHKWVILTIWYFAVLQVVFALIFPVLFPYCRRNERAIPNPPAGAGQNSF